MSLSKTYRLRCDASELQMDRVMAVASDHDDFKTRLEETRPERQAERDDCTSFSVSEDNAQQARRSAKAQGWIRHHEQRPIYAGSDTMTKVSYDVCAPCSGRLGLCS